MRCSQGSFLRFLWCFFSRPGRCQGLLYKYLWYSLINSLIHPLVPTALQRRHAQTVREVFQFKNRLCHSGQKLFKSRRASKSHQWFQSYGHFTDGVNFAYWWHTTLFLALPAKRVRQVLRLQVGSSQRKVQIVFIIYLDVSVIPSI